MDKDSLPLVFVAVAGAFAVLLTLFPPSVNNAVFPTTAGQAGTNVGGDATGTPVTIAQSDAAVLNPSRAVITDGVTAQLQYTNAIACPAGFNAYVTSSSSTSFCQHPTTNTIIGSWVKYATWTQANGFSIDIINANKCYSSCSSSMAPNVIVFVARASFPKTWSFVGTCTAGSTSRITQCSFNTPVNAGDFVLVARYSGGRQRYDPALDGINLLAVLPASICGDGVCQSTETATTCPIDCRTTPICGNGVIETGEQCDTGSARGACPATCSQSCTLNNCSDTTTPTASFVNPTQGQKIVYPSQSIPIYVTASEPVVDCHAGPNDAPYANLPIVLTPSPVNNWIIGYWYPTSYSVSGYSVGSWTLFVRCRDLAGNVAPSSTRVDFSIVPLVSVTLSASPNTINSGQSSTLSWSSANAVYCNASESVYSPLGFRGTWATSGATPVYPTTTTTYALNCTNGTQSAVAQAMVSVGAPVDSIPPVLAGATYTRSTTKLVTLSISTNEPATCRYATTDISYASMGGSGLTFMTTGGTTHSTSAIALQGSATTFFIRCADAAGNANTASAVIVAS